MSWRTLEGFASQESPESFNDYFDRGAEEGFIGNNNLGVLTENFV